MIKFAPLTLLVTASTFLAAPSLQRRSADVTGTGVWSSTDFQGECFGLNFPADPLVGSPCNGVGDINRDIFASGSEGSSQLQDFGQGVWSSYSPLPTFSSPEGAQFVGSETPTDGWTFTFT
ncbi:hypothetical protein B0H19DRAFT_1079664 [Mycena capillaripes]|nr:hypothetical protein B0H19DRAFT_1079664 [Mycena capillaripes]